MGALLGLVVSTLVGPRIISWWYEPPSKDAFSCAKSVEGALQKFVWLQLGSAVCGVIFLALVLFFVRRALGTDTQKDSANPVVP